MNEWILLGNWFKEHYVWVFWSITLILFVIAIWMGSVKVALTGLVFLVWSIGVATHKASQNMY